MNLYDILAGQGTTHFERLFSQRFAGGAVQTLTGQPPLSFKSDGTPLTSVTIKGNGVQNGTPSPQNIVPFDGTGERTGNLANLWNVDATFLHLRYTTGSAMTISISGTKTEGNNVHSIATPGIILPAGNYTIKIKMTSGTITGLSDGVFFGINRNTYAQRTTPGVKAVGEVGTRTFTLSDDTLITSLDITPGYGNSGSVFTNAIFECGLYAGSSAPADYEPYGWKIPITCAGQTTPLYLGEVSTTRRIRKLVLTGNESGALGVDSTNHIFALRGIFNSEPELLQVGGICTHYKYNNAVSSLASNMQNGDFVLNRIVNDYSFTIKDNSFNTADDFKSYLSAQYANGTPVTVWYVLAEPTTGIVNEPLCKIGDYCDELYSEDAAVTIPTAKGQNTLTVDTELQPSEMTITFK